MKPGLDVSVKSSSVADSNSTTDHSYGIDSECMKKAALYARVSGDHQQKEGTIRSQIAELRRQITAAGQSLVKEYIDDGYSGADMDRPALEQMRQELKADVFDSIYFPCNDRIAREVAHQLIIVDELRKHGKRIIINGKDYEENPENKLSLTMFGAFAEFERAKIMERSKRGKLHRLRSGQVLGQGLSPYGYDYVSRTPTSPAALHQRTGSGRGAPYLRGVRDRQRALRPRPLARSARNSHAARQDVVGWDPPQNNTATPYVHRHEVLQHSDHDHAAARPWLEEEAPNVPTTRQVGMDRGEGSPDRLARAFRQRAGTAPTEQAAIRASGSSPSSRGDASVRRGAASVGARCIRTTATTRK